MSLTAMLNRQEFDVAHCVFCRNVISMATASSINCDWSMEIQFSANNSLSVQMSQHATSRQSFYYTMLSLTAWVVVLYCTLVGLSICPFQCCFSRVTQPPLWLHQRIRLALLFLYRAFCYSFLCPFGLKFY